MRISEVTTKQKQNESNPIPWNPVFASKWGMRRFHVIGGFKNLKNQRIHVQRLPQQKQGMKQTNPKNPKNQAHPTTLFLHSHLYKVGPYHL